MTETSPGDVQIATEEQFATALEQLLVAAAENDVDPQGAWVVRNGDSPPDWEVVVMELAKQEPPDGNTSTS